MEGGGQSETETCAAAESCQQGNKTQNLFNKYLRGEMKSSSPLSSILMHVSFLYKYCNVGTEPHYHSLIKLLSELMMNCL